MITPGLESPAERVRALLALHSVENATQEHVDAIVASIERMNITKATTGPALGSRKCARAVAGIEAMLRHAVVRPRRTVSTAAARAKVLAEVDSLAAVIKLAAASRTNIAASVERLRQGCHSLEDLHVLRRALLSVRPGRGAGPPNARYLPLLRAAVIVWEACGRRERYSFNQHVDPPALQGPLPALMRDLLRLSGAPVPTDEVLHRHLRALKNL